MNTLQILEKVGAHLKQGIREHSGIGATPGSGLGVGSGAKVHASLDNPVKNVLSKNKPMSAGSVTPTAKQVTAAMKLAAGLKLAPQGTGLGNAAAPKPAAPKVTMPQQRPTMGQNIAANQPKPAAPATQPKAPVNKPQTGTGPDIGGALKGVEKMNVGMARRNQAGNMLTQSMQNMLGGNNTSLLGNIGSNVQEVAQAKQQPRMMQQQFNMMQNL